VQEDEAEGSTYFDHGKQKDVFQILKDYGFNYIRLRVFVNPASPRGYAARSKEPFCDAAHTAAMAKRARAAGMGLLVDLHYSDTWADPGKQFKPAAWENLDLSALKKAVYDHTTSVLSLLKAQGTTPDMVQIGNEVTNGMLWPDGRAKDHFDNFAELVNSGIDAARAVDPAIKIVLHHDKGNNNKPVRWWLDNLLSRGVKFDIIGLSCNTDGPAESWKANFDDLAMRYPQYGLLAAEYSYRKREVNDVVFNAPDRRGLGSFIWEPTRHHEAFFDQNGHNAGVGTQRPPRAATQPAPTPPVVPGHRPRAGRFDTNDLIALYPRMAKDYASDSPAPTNPKPVEGDFVVKDFKFKSGELLPELKIHYRTIGKPRKDRDGVVRNAVLALHGTTGNGGSLTVPSFAGVLCSPGGILDASNYYIVFPDGIGHGKSSKPSDGLHARFPKYTYDDMVAAQYRLLTEGLGVNHLRLVIGTSMGGMHTWVWGETYPDFMDALMPLASAPVEIAGRNRVWRKMIIDAIRTDPGWNNGDYTTQPRSMEAVSDIMTIMGSAPLHMHEEAPTRAAADRLAHAAENRMHSADANDVLYAFNASREYNPAPLLGKIKAPLTAVNSADDEINPPELGILEREIKKVPRGKYVLIPISAASRGHGSHTIADLWKRDLEELLRESERPQVNQ
jgi:homoserine O-acetyltransferase